MLISAAIIVKNEEEVLERCLASVSNFADEIVIVDTGSTDRTKEIAQAHPKVKLFDSDHFGSWTHFSEFSFSIAKNEAVDKCTGDWVIWWDADDFADEENAAKIRKLAEETDSPCLYSFCVKYGPLSFEHCRMFRNGYNIKFDEAHSVHEYLNTLGYPNISRHEIIINHIPGKKHVPSGERNIAIMENDYYNRGMDDPRTLFYLANGYREAGRFQDAIDFYKKYLEKSIWAEERFFARYYMAQAYVFLENLAEAKREALRANAEDLRFAETYCMLGDIFFREGDYKRAQAWFILAFETPYPQDAKLFVTPALYQEYPMSRIKDCHEKLLSGLSEKQNVIPPIPDDIRKEMESTVRIADSVQRVAGAFELPKDKEEAVLAASVLDVIARRKNVLFGVSTEYAALSSLEGLTKADGDTISLNLPPKLNGRPREEWYGRAAGHMFDDWEPIVNESRRVAEEARRAIDADSSIV